MRQALAGWALLALGAAAPAAARTVYTVVRVGSDLTGEQIVGVRRAGLACLPAGKLRWAQVDAGTNTDQREAVQDALEDADLPVVPFGEYSGERGDAETPRLRGVVKAAAFDLCAKHWLGDANALSGEARLDVEWRIESRAQAGVAQRHLSHVARTIGSHQAAPLASIYRLLLQDAARDLAGWLQSPARSPA